MKRSEIVSLTDFSYGEFLVYSNEMPFFYYSAFTDNGELNNIAIYAKENNIGLENLIIMLLKNDGFNNVTTVNNHLLLIRQENKSYLKEFSLKMIVEYIK